MVVPSPQLIVAVKSLAVAFGLASVKVATVMVRGLKKTLSLLPRIRPGDWAMSAASAMFALLVALAVLAPTSVMVTSTEYLPSSA